MAEKPEKGKRRSSQTSIAPRFIVKGQLFAIIADEDLCVGFLFVGIGDVHAQRGANYFIVTKNTTPKEIETQFLKFLKRSDIAIILISQNVAEMIRKVVDAHDIPLPAVLEIPSRDHPYDTEKDSIFRRARKLMHSDPDE